jgi:transcriptional regulator with XRE-family HTH domain
MYQNGEPNHRIRATRETRGLSLRELAHFVGCSHTTISRLERGEIDVSAELKARIAHALATPVQELWPAPGA